MIHKTKKSFKWLRRGVIALCVLVALAGALFILIEPIKDLIRGRYSDKAVELFKEGEVTVAVPKTDALSVDGEDGQEVIQADKIFKDLSALNEDYESLTIVGLLEIPCIEVEEVVFDCASTLALRYGCGKFEGTVDIGEPGLCSVWGHRNQGGDDNLDRLEELQDSIGDIVYVTTPDYVRHEYEIVECIYAKDAEIMPFMYGDTYDDETLAIVTCGYGTNYKGDWHAYNTEFIVICKPTGTTEVFYE